MNHQIKKQTVLLVLTSCIYVVILFCLQIWVSRYPVGRIQEIKYFIIFIPYISYVLVGQLFYSGFGIFGVVHKVRF